MTPGEAAALVAAAWRPRLRHTRSHMQGLSNVGYKDRLEILSLESLQLRRLHQDLIYS